MYASGRAGWADHELTGPRKDLSALFDLVINHVPVPGQLSKKMKILECFQQRLATILLLAEF